MSEKEAIDRANRYKNHDPLDEIPASLLGSDDFLDYARVTGMIWPCAGLDADKNPIPGRVKPASYEVFPGKLFLRYDEDGELISKEISADSRDTLLHLPPNSISFVSTNETIRLPNYIAMRFNLRIQHVHRGLLLGTGPIVDPGFGKDILIPLHNLTDDDYYISINEGLIWVEFTKTSWIGESATGRMKNHDVPLPGGTEKDLRDFLTHANQGRPIRSSIPKAVIEAKAAATAADRRARQLEQQIRAVSIGALIVLILTLAGLLAPVVGLVQDTASMLRQSQVERQAARAELEMLDRRVRVLCQRQAALSNERRTPEAC